MGKKVLIIGAVAVGPKVACRVRRLDPDAEITLIDRDSLISYGGCGIPYYVGGDVNEVEDLYKTTYHAIRDDAFFLNRKGIKIVTRVEAQSIDRREKTVRVVYLDSGQEELFAYDTLVLATGAKAVRPPFPGVDLARVFTVSDLHDAQAIKGLMAQGKVGRAVVIGAGAIGLEITEALTDLWGIETTLIEMEDQILPTLLGKNIARLTEQELRNKDVELLLNERVMRVDEDKDGETLLVTTSKVTIETDIVVLAAGVRPNSELAKAAGLATGRSGGILVDTRMRTTDPDIYAGGDCIELRNLISGENMMMALGSLANREGRVMASNICGKQSELAGAVGSFCVKVFDIGISKAGLTYKQAMAAGFDPVCAVVSQGDHAHFYPDSEIIYLSLLADRNSRKILGIEAAGKNGVAVKARVDAVAVLLGHGVDVDEICTLEVAYAPPYGSAMDVVNNAGNALDNVLSGSSRPIDVVDFLEEFKSSQARVLDIRGNKEATPFMEKYGDRWLNIPQDQIREKASELSKDEQFYLLCDTGPRSYEAQVYLSSVGVKNTKNIQGGFALIKATAPDFI